MKVLIALFFALTVYLSALLVEELSSPDNNIKIEFAASGLKEGRNISACQVFYKRISNCGQPAFYSFCDV